MLAKSIINMQNFMPELPEVQTTCDGIKPHILGKKVTDVVVRTPKLRWAIPHDLKSHLMHQIVKSIHRRAKYIIIELDDIYLIIHLGMSGHLRVLKEYLMPSKHDHVDITFENEITLRYNDPRRFGAILIASDISNFPLFKNLGPEPLTQNFNWNALKKSIENKSTPIKTHIMNQKTVVGIGNIYASEALFQARIHPLRPAQSITSQEGQQLIKSIQMILEKAIDQGGTSISDYMNSEGKPGYFSQELQVYQRTCLPCYVCNSPIEQLRIGQRGSFYCPSCQK